MDGSDLMYVSGLAILKDGVNSLFMWVELHHQSNAVAENIFWQKDIWEETGQLCIHMAPMACQGKAFSYPSSRFCSHRITIASVHLLR